MIRGCVRTQLQYFHSPLALESYSFLVAITTGGRSHFRLSPLGYPLLRLSTYARELSHTSWPPIICLQFILFFFNNYNHPSPSCVTCLKSLFKYVKFISFRSQLLGSSNSFFKTNLKTILKYSWMCEMEVISATNKLCTHSKHINVNGVLHATFCGKQRVVYATI